MNNENTNILPNGTENIPVTSDVLTTDTTAPVEATGASVENTAEVAVKTDEIPGETTLNTEIKMDFEPNDFVEELPTMGKGMLGIFIVIGIIIGATCLLNFIFKPRKK